MRKMLFVLLLTAAFPIASAGDADAPYGLLDIALGASYAQLGRMLDLRDINAALAARNATGKPDLGRRGYGCMTREDEFADVSCVSHDERLDGVTTREIRLQFLAGRLQQMSLTAEARYFDAVLDYLRRRYGPPTVTVEDSPRYQWRNASSRLYAMRGPNLVFVSLELTGYPTAVARKRERGSAAPECR
ncbi:MAG TPA: hypothetical protein VMT94_03975 [Burkholderiales bacterium]|nr:hypothetical protein [Burkholderiales bacterium]